MIESLHFSPRPMSGMTLIELCFGLALIAVIAGLSAPGFRSSLRAAAVRAATFELMAGVQQVRSQSIVQSRSGELCPSNAAGACQPARIDAAYWRWSLDAGRLAAGEVHALPDGIVLRVTRSPLRFSPDALTASTGTLTICDRQHVATPRAIVMSQTGRARLASASAGECS